MVDQAQAQDSFVIGNAPPNEGQELKNMKFSGSIRMRGQIEGIKKSLNDWKGVLLPIKSLLQWEKQWHPTAIIAGSTVIFTLLWLIDPSILTVLSLIGIILTLCDYFGPSLAAPLLKPDKWTDMKERDFDNLITNLVIWKAKLELTWSNYYKLKFTNPKMYYIITILLLGIFAWVGCTFNNLFLAYIVFTFALLYPGMDHNGMISKWTSSTRRVLTDFINEAKSRVGQPKKVQ